MDDELDHGKQGEHRQYGYEHHHDRADPGEDGDKPEQGEEGDGAAHDFLDDGKEAPEDAELRLDATAVVIRNQYDFATASATLLDGQVFSNHILAHPALEHAGKNGFVQQLERDERCTDERDDERGNRQHREKNTDQGHQRGHAEEDRGGQARLIGARELLDLGLEARTFFEPFSNELRRLIFLFRPCGPGTDLLREVCNIVIQF